MRTELASNFSLSRSVEAFYTGGTVQWTRDGSTVYTPCGSVVKSIEIDTGQPGNTVGDGDDTCPITTIRLADDDSSMVISYSNLLLRKYQLSPMSILDEKLRKRAILERQWKSMHKGPVLVLEFSNNATILASGSADFTIKVWDLLHQYCTHTLKVGTSPVSQLLFPASRPNWLVAGYSDGSIRVFDLAAESAHLRLISTWDWHSSRVSALVLDLDNHLVSVSRDQTAVVINMDTGARLKTVPLFEPIESAVMTPTGNLVSTGQQGHLKMWDLSTGLVVRSIGSICCSAVQLLHCRNRSSFLSIAADHNLTLIDENSFETIKQFVGFNDELLATEFIGDEADRLAVGANSPDLRLYDTRDWSCTLVTGHTDSILTINSATWNRDIFATGSKDNSVIVWNAGDSSNVRKLALATGHTKSVSAVKFGRSNKQKFLLTVSHDSTLKVWPLSGLKFDENIDQDPPPKLSASSTVVAHLKDITSLDISPNDRLCATGSMDKSVRLWHLDAVKMTVISAGTIVGHKRGVWDVRFSDTDQVVATASGDCTVKIFALADRSCVRTFEGHSSAVIQQLISTDSGGLIKLWTIRSNECVKTIEAHDGKIWTLTISSDCSNLVTGGSDARLLIWDDVTEKERLLLEEQRKTKTAHQQQLANLIDQDRHEEALILSLKLTRPGQALTIVDRLIESDRLKSVVDKIDAEQTIRLLQYALQWNTNSRTSHTAQRVLFQVLHCRNPSELISYSDFQSIIESFLPYTKRHFDRLTIARQQATFLEYTWQKMRLSDDQ